MKTPRIAAIVLVVGGLVAAAGPVRGEARPDTSTCPESMVEIAGDYCPTLEQSCLRSLPASRDAPVRCVEFAPSAPCHVPTVKKHFCIDRFEYPNQRGKRPVVMKSFVDAQEACKAEGTRLCTDSEWTLACEGRERLPYPYGTKRSAEACNIDRPLREVDSKALFASATRDVELSRLWQGEESGARASCVSPFGVFDLTGNVDEWVVNESGKPFKSGLKGGYWGTVRAQCRPMTTGHDETFAFYQTGVRCCADASVE